MAEKLEELPIAIPQIGQDRILVQLSRMYEKDPLKAVREYLTNSLDAIDKSKTNKGKIVVALDPYARSLVIADNASGMSQRQMDELSSNIGHSEKFDKIDQRGEKGVGLLSFGSVGSSLQVVSREGALANNSYNYIHWRREEIGSEEKIKAYRSQYRKTEEDITKEFYGPFQSGTQIIMGLTEDVLKEKLTQEELIRAIQDLYLPLFHNQRVSFAFAQINRDKNGRASLEERVIKVPEMPGETLIKERIPFVSTRAKKGSLPEKYELDVMLVFNGEDESGKVGVYSRDVKVYDSIIELDKDFKKDPFWTCGFIRGYINEPLLRLTLGRDGFIKDNVGETNVYKDMKSVLMEISRKRWPVVMDQIEKIKIKKGSSMIEEILPLLEEAYQEGQPLSIVRRETRPRGPIIIEVPRGPRGPIVDSGPEDKEQRRRKLPCHFRTGEFEMIDQNLRSKNKTDLSGERYIMINEKHLDYVEVMSRGTPEQKREYLMEVAIERIPELEMLNAIDNGKPYSDREIPTKLIDRLEELRFKLNKVIKTPRARRIIKKKKN